MSAERDRLAALLMEVEHANDVEEEDYYRAYADRLIAAGVGDVTQAHVALDRFIEAADIALSIREDLIRDGSSRLFPALEPLRHARMLAAAYREDAG